MKIKNFIIKLLGGVPKKDYELLENILDISSNTDTNKKNTDDKILKMYQGTIDEIARDILIGFEKIECHDNYSNIEIQIERIADKLNSLIKCQEVSEIKNTHYIKTFLNKMEEIKTSSYFRNKMKNLKYQNKINLEIENNQLNDLFLAFTNLTHNFNSESLNDNKFDEQTSSRIREVSTFYRLLSSYSHYKYQIIPANLFSKLRDFIFYEFHDTFKTGIFTDENFNKFNKLKSEIELELEQNIAR